jgi:cobalamin biosynthesis protein CobW
MDKLPTTIVTGFLGSGKTTLLRHLLTHAEGRRLAVIVNEFGEVGVDGELLRQCGIGCEPSSATEAPGALYELANGCLCCTVQEELVPVLEQLMERRGQIDHILIETSGLALPKPLVQAFQWPEIRAACTVDAVIALVDGPAVLSGQFAEDLAAVEAQRQADPSLDHERPLQELFEDQLAAADLVIIGKADELAPAELERVRAQIRAIAPRGVKLLSAVRGELPLDVVLGQRRAAEDSIDTRHTHHDEDHAAGREHSHELFDTIVMRLGELERATLLRGLEAVVQEHEVYRAKGFAAVPGKALPLVVQGVGRRFDSYFAEPSSAQRPRTTELVLIGSHLDHDRVMRTMLEATRG